MAKSNADEITENIEAKQWMEEKYENHLKTDQKLFRESVVDMKAGVFIS